MKVLIVAKTRMGGGACIGAITEEGESVRLIPFNDDPRMKERIENTRSEIFGKFPLNPCNQFDSTAYRKRRGS